MHDISIWCFLFRYQGSLSGWEIKWPRCKTSLRGQLLSSYACLLPPSQSAPVTWPPPRSSYLCWPPWWVHRRWRRIRYKSLKWSSRIVCFMLNWILPMEWSTETTPSTNQLVFPCLVYPSSRSFKLNMLGPFSRAPPPINNLPNTPIQQ